jgi:hypothetical protein
MCIRIPLNLWCVKVRSRMFLSMRKKRTRSSLIRLGSISRFFCSILWLAAVDGMTTSVVGQSARPMQTPGESSIPSSAFSIPRALPSAKSGAEISTTPRMKPGGVMPLLPPRVPIQNLANSASGRSRNLSVQNASSISTRAQEFLEDIPPRSTQDDLLPLPAKSFESVGNSDSLLPAPVKNNPSNLEDLLDDAALAKPETSNEISSQNELFEEREKSPTPYPMPDFSSPSETVIPLHIQKAPADFKGFEPTSPDDLNLPEPRRIFPLPKIYEPSTVPERISRPQSEQTQPQRTGADSQADSAKKTPSTLPWHSDSFSGSVQFPSLLGSSSSNVIGASTFGMQEPYYQEQPLQYVGVPQVYLPEHRIPRGLEDPQQPTNLLYCKPTPICATDNSLPYHDRLNRKRWLFQHARQLPTSKSPTPVMTEQMCLVPYQPNDFAPVPYDPQPLDPQREIETYYSKQAVDTQRPWVEWGRPFYTGGMYAPGVPVFSDVNLLTPSFLVYGDYRNGVGVHRNNGKPVRTWANRLNLDMDLRLTSTERFHIFTGPLDHNGQFTRLDFSNNNVVFVEELDAQVDTAFFEGDLGAITGSWLGDDAPFDLPFTCGLVPLLYQNGIWMEDAIAGFALGSPWRHSRALNWANYEATFFAGFNQVTSPAFNNDNNAAAVYGTAWFIEAYSGYIESDYAYLDDLDGLGRSYHNAAIAYTRRYFGRISNSVRLIGNIGQSGPAINRSADGALLLFENSLISSQPSTIVPYWNFFVGNGRPQSVARAGGAGGILRNTGINFETDGLTGYPTLNATGSNSYGGAVGLNLLSADFRNQLVLEFASLDTYGNPALSAAAGPEYAIGTRFQTALNNRLIWRVDLMNGWFDNAPDIYGTRTEIRWKF